MKCYKREGITYFYPIALSRKAVQVDSRSDARVAVLKKVLAICATHNQGISEIKNYTLTLTMACAIEILSNKFHPGHIAYICRILFLSCTGCVCIYII